MKVLILAGGLGTRLSEETGIRPKPMVELGGKPILWHIMKIYSYCGFTHFVVLTGYKSHIIKDFFINYYYRYSDVSIDMSANRIDIKTPRTENWKIDFLYTGEETMTGARIKRAQNFVGGEPFLLTYGDGVSDVDINSVVEFHRKSGAIVTLTAVRPAEKFGVVDVGSDGVVSAFREKRNGDSSWINGGFFVCEPEAFDYIPDGDDAVFERDTLEILAEAGKLSAYKYGGFWKSMDTLRDKIELNKMWSMGNAPWAKWTGR